jgi:hypothetical protein
VLQIQWPDNSPCTLLGVCMLQKPVRDYDYMLELLPKKYMSYFLASLLSHEMTSGTPGSSPGTPLLRKIVSRFML